MATLGPLLVAIGQGLLALLQFLVRVVMLLGLWLLSIVLKRPLQSMIVLLMLVVLVSIHRDGPNNPHAVENAIRFVLPIAILLVAIIICKGKLKLPKW